MFELLLDNIKSSDGIHSLYCKIYLPKDQPIKGIFHVVHGMTEYLDRYDKFMSDMAERGYICAGFDNLGHGHSVNNDSELGFIAEKDGWKYLIDDVQLFSEYLKNKYGNLPYTLMGHSMGSFIVRVCEYYHPVSDKLIIMGTGGPVAISGLGLFLAKMNKAVFGAWHISKFMDNLIFGAYNKKFEHETTVDWLSHNKESKDAYLKDKYCTFKFTISAIVDLITLNTTSNSKKWFSGFDKTKPILLLSGKDDPVGDFGKGIEKVNNLLKKNKCNVKMHLFEGYRHEILNEECYFEVVDIINNFVSD